MAGYVVHHYNIIDRDRVDQLGPKSLKIAEKYGATVLVGSPVKTLTGTSDYSHMVIYKLDSFEAALRFYHSPEMAEFSEFRDQIINGFSAVLPGHDETEAVVDSGYFAK